MEGSWFGQIRRRSRRPCLVTAKRRSRAKN